MPGRVGRAEILVGVKQNLAGTEQIRAPIQQDCEGRQRIPWFSTVIPEPAEQSSTLVEQAPAPAEQGLSVMTHARARNEQASLPIEHDLEGWRLIPADVEQATGPGAQTLGRVSQVSIT